MDIEALEFRALCMQAIRKFFINEMYLELDTPAMAKALIPESCLEVFATDYVSPSGKVEKRYLTPSPEVFIKPIIAQHGKSVFQLSKCYRNSESVGHIHRPEFTMLEYYTVNADYCDSIRITEKFFSFLAEQLKDNVLADSNMLQVFNKKFYILTMDEAFKKYAGFALSSALDVNTIAMYAKSLGLGDEEKLKTFAWDDLYEMILVQAVEPNLPKNKIVALIDYPAGASCLAGEHTVIAENGKPFLVKERWEIYVNGVELANCYTEERNQNNIDEYFANETALKEHAIVPHLSVSDFGAVCAKMPECSGVALGVDRLIMLLAGKKSLDSFVYDI